MVCLSGYFAVDALAEDASTDTTSVSPVQAFTFMTVPATSFTSQQRFDGLVRKFARKAGAIPKAINASITTSMPMICF
ncbi:hypothetical protein C6P99_24555 [Burkholderia multivorans]|uniref:Uncharacterized protein n=1 Tax=Burkholderia multivorans TaxID=87883 RepID=A0AB37APM0_9BURK|nr:hypothetical protein C6P99_24555 [Burkholderia multivorans]